jgi:hypothetical protein
VNQGCFFEYFICVSFQTFSMIDSFQIFVYCVVTLVLVIIIDEARRHSE